MPSVTFACPGSRQRWPKQRRLLVAEHRDDRELAAEHGGRRCAERPSESTIGGSSGRGTPNSSSSSPSHAASPSANEHAAPRVARVAHVERAAASPYMSHEATSP